MQFSQRALRGLVRWGIWDNRDDWPPRDHRKGTNRGSWGLNTHPDRPKGHCAWCWLPRDPKQHYQANYHGDCALVMTMLKGVRRTPYGKWVIPKVDCQCGAEGTELDHVLPLSLAVREGLRVWIRAFLPPNLQWLCVDCHRKKTRSDLARLSYLRRPESPEKDPDAPTLQGTFQL